MRRRAAAAALSLSLAGVSCALAPAAAQAFNPVKPLCNAAGWISGIAGKACHALSNSDKIVSAGKKLLSGHPGAAAKALLGGATGAGIGVGLAGISAWVLVGAKVAMHETATAISHTTSPQLASTWFSSTYWRMAAIAALLTLPFLFAASVQALMHSDVALLLRAALGYLPLALLSVSVAAPVTMLLLAATDQMSAAVSAAAGHQGVLFLDKAGGFIGALSAIDGSPFLAFLVGLCAVVGAVVLWLELVIREVAVYVVVMMLPLAFAAMVWPARRIWAIRAVELLVALILSKFAIVAVLSLAAAALGHTSVPGPGTMMAGVALLTLAAFAPWALVRLLPLAELASTAAGSMRGELTRAQGGVAVANDGAEIVTSAMESHLAQTRVMRDDEQEEEGDKGDRGRESAQTQTEGLAEVAAHSSEPGGGADGEAELEAPGGEAACAEPAAAGANGARRTRIPELDDPRWQMPDGTWDEVTLGLEGLNEVPDGDAELPLPPEQEPGDGHL